MWKLRCPRPKGSTLWLLGAIALMGMSLGSLSWWLDYSALVTLIRSWGTYAVAGYVVLFAVATAVGVPGTFFPMIAGALFGWVWGSVWALLGATLGAILAFLVARYCAYDWLQQRIAHHPWLHTLQQSVASQPFWFILAVRLAPFSPFSLVNFGFGLTAIPVTVYAAATFIGLIPSIVTYAWLGAAGDTLLTTGNQLPFLAASLALLFLTVLPLWWQRRKRPTKR
ncbi:TVP38/TMEM64 family protein [Synechococcus sp. PCC 6716]|nr:TVP38/TMEM64 family protein [Synechococcus sp. PCC 6716]